MKRILLFILTLFASVAVAQERFDYVKRHNPWNEGLNAAGLRRDTTSRSYAEAFFVKENGGMIDFSSSDDSFTLGAQTESIRHFDRVSFAGSFRYAYFDGENMKGSMFMYPGFYPVDIMEFTPGRKIRENYSFTGAISTRLTKSWDLGARINFAASNYAKRKDLRHSNKRLDLEVMPGVLFHRGDWAVGAAYIYLKNNERVSAKEIGSTAESYEAFFNKGLGFGVLERWDGNGTHLDETGSGVSGFPIAEQGHGAGIQLQYKTLYADLSAKHRTGETGEKGVYWHDFESTDVAADIVWSIRPEHTLRLNFDWTTTDNSERIFTRETVDGITTTFYYGSTPIFASDRTRLSAQYELHKTQKWNLRASLSWQRTEGQSTLYYPYVKEEQIDEYIFATDALFHLGQWELSAGVTLRGGDRSSKEHDLEAALETGAYPEELTSYTDYRNEYLTATRMGLSASLRRNIRHFYVDLGVVWEHGFALRWVAQPNRLRAQLSLGYNF